MGIAVVDDKLEAALKYSRDVDGIDDKPGAALPVSKETASIYGQPHTCLEGNCKHLWTASHLKRKFVHLGMGIAL